VCSLRPDTPAAPTATIHTCHPSPPVHAAPLPRGYPAQIGIRDINTPDVGDAVTIKEGELPVFWACGVTPQVAIEQAKPEFCITHSPGHMLITDLPNSRLAVL